MISTNITKHSLCLNWQGLLYYYFCFTSETYKMKYGYIRDASEYKQFHVVNDERRIIMKVVAVRPGQVAKVEEIGCELRDMQKFVGGYIEAIYPFEDKVALVCNA